MEQIATRFIPLLIFSFVAGIASLVIFLFFRNGAFLPVEIEVKEQSEMFFLAKKHMGPYHQIATQLDEISKAAASAQLECKKTFGEFLDDPNVVESERLQSHLGCVLEQKPEPSKIPASYFLIEKPRQLYIIAQFKGSPALGPYKVYGKAETLKNERQLTATGAPLEIYETLSSGEFLTTFYFPVKSAQ